MLPLEHVTINELVARSAKKFAGRPAVLYKGQTLTYEELDKRIQIAAENLKDYNVRKGTHVGILCESCTDLIVVFFALLRLGAIPVMVGTSCRRQEIQNAIEHCDISLLLIGDGHRDISYKEETLGLSREIETLQGIYTVSKMASFWSRAREPKGIETQVNPEDTDCILFTSGTTSKPKAVLTTHYARANIGLQQGMDLKLTPEDKVLIAMPVFHCFSLTVNVMAPLFYGACICIPDSRHTKDILSMIEQEQVTVMSGVPAFLDALIKREDFLTRNLESLRVGFLGGAFCSPKQFEYFQKNLPYTILSSLGQTEATSGITTVYDTDDLETRAKTVGHVMDHMEYKITKPGLQKPLPKGKKGELCIKGYNIMQGYYKDPEATRKVLNEEGWLKTGDLCYEDENGNLVICGRVKEIIIRGGENISARELEAVLEDNPKIKECKAVGVPSDHYGEEVAIAVILKDNETMTEEEIINLYKDQVAYYKVPSYVVFMKTFPKTRSGKIWLDYLKRICTSNLGLEG